MKNVFAAVLATALLACTAGLATAASLSLVPSQTVVDTGSTFEIDVVVSGLEGTMPEENLGGYDLTITFDDTLFSFVDASFGAELGGPVDSDSFTTPGLGDVSVFEVSLILPLDPFFATQPDSFTLATLTFEALDLGTGNFDFVFGPFSFLADEDGFDLPVDGTAGTAVRAVPVPAALWLLGSGLGLAGLRRIRK